MVRIYEYSDSGPYGYFVTCPDEWTTAQSGFGTTPIYEVPDDLWDRYERAKAALDEAEDAIWTYVENQRG